MQMKISWIAFLLMGGAEPSATCEPDGCGEKDVDEDPLDRFPVDGGI
jgi:hypothetical protein